MMNERVLVAVFRVGDSGRTEDKLGWAILVDAECALACPPLNQQLAREPCPLRVGIWWGDGGIEVIDVTRSHILEDAPELVVLELSSTSSVPDTAIDPFSECASERSRDDAIAWMRTILDRAALLEWPEEGDPKKNPIRWLKHALGL